MKKFLALLLALMMCLSLAACGGDSSEDSAAEDAAVSEDGPTSKQIQAVTEAYNQVATLYNEVATTANENGWMADEQTAADIQTIGATLEPVGTALTGDLSALDGADFDALPDALLEYVPDLEALAEKVAEPYGGEGATVVTDEALIPVANAVNEVVPIFNEVYELAEANGWLEDEQTATELQTVMGTLTFTQSALTDDPSKLENVTDFDALANSILQLAPALEEIAERVSVPYEG